MKKLFILSLIFGFCACTGNKAPQKEVAVEDSIEVITDSITVDSVVIDSALVDTIVFD